MSDEQNEQTSIAPAMSEPETILEAQPAPTQAQEIPYPNLRTGMTVRLHERITDVSPKGEKRERVQMFEGIITNLHGGANERTLTIRKVTSGVGVEKIFPVSSPNIVKIEMVKYAKTRRNVLHFLRGFRRKLKETWVK